MGLFISLKRLFMGPAHSPEFVAAFTSIAKALGYRITWDSVDENFCTFDVLIDQQLYWLWFHLWDLNKGDNIQVLMSSKIKPAELTTATRAELLQRNQELLIGKWIISPERIALTTTVPLSGLDLDRIEGVIKATVSEVSAFDRKQLAAALSPQPHNNRLVILG